MKALRKYLVPGIVVSILIFMLSIASGQTQIKRLGTIFQRAYIKIDENQDAPIEVRFEEKQKVSIITFFEQYKKAFDWSDNNEARSFKAFTDKLGQTHQRFKQYYKGVELAEAQYLLHEKEGSIFYAHGKLIHGLDMDVTPVISESEALKKALDHINAG
jgi:Zn-dependent metalloprotease